jgi:hypothetical protein
MGVKETRKKQSDQLTNLRQGKIIVEVEMAVSKQTSTPDWKR